MLFKSISKALMANINTGIKSGRVITLVIASLLFFELLIDAVIDEMNTRLKRERETKRFVYQK